MWAGRAVERRRRGEHAACGSSWRRRGEHGAPADGFLQACQLSQSATHLTSCHDDRNGLLPLPAPRCADEDLLVQELRAGVLKPSHVLIK